MGTWLAPFKHIHRRHDVRFDTAYMPKSCKIYHLVLHKRDPINMRRIYEPIYRANHCNDPQNNISLDPGKQIKEYFYDWYQSPSKCCDNIVR